MEEIIAILVFSVIIFIIVFLQDKNSYHDEYKTYHDKYKTTVDLSWIDSKLAYLIQKTGYVRPRTKFIFEFDLDFYNSSDLQYNSDILTKHIGLDTSPKIKMVKTSPDIDNSKKWEAGSFYYNIRGEPIIEIYYKRIRNSKALFAVLAHEMAHYFLYDNNKISYNIKKNEYLTDLTAIYLGFGKLLLNGYEPIKKTSQKSNGKYLTEESIYGYLKVKDIANIFVILCYFYKISLDKAKRNLDKQAKIHIEKSASYILEIQKTIINNSSIKEKIIMKCHYCEQKLRFPRKKKDLKIICPNCNNRILLYSDLFIGIDIEGNKIKVP